MFSEKKVVSVEGKKKKYQKEDILKEDILMLLVLLTCN